MGVLPDQALARTEPRPVYRIALLGLLLSVTSCEGPQRPATAADQQARSSPQQPLTVSLLQLIVRPDDFDNEYVRVFGFYRNEFEGTAIYLHREDYQQALAKNGVWVTQSSEEHDMKYVLIEGRFNAKHHGHMGLWSGEIGEVTRMMEWPPVAARPAR